MATKIYDRVPLRVVHSDEQSGAPDPAELIGCRFMGVLMHPVHWTEMERRFNVKCHGCRIVVRWPTQPCGAHPVKAGDALEIDGKPYAVYGVTERPGCYLDVYVKET